MQGLAVMLVVLIGPWLATRVTMPRRDHRIAGVLGASLLLLVTGTAHFTRTADFVAMLPPIIPMAEWLVWGTGVLELLLATLLLPPAFRRTSGFAVVIMLVAFTPVNIYAAWRGAPVGGHEWGMAYLLIRVPVQVFIGWWVWHWAIRTPTQPNRTPKPFEEYTSEHGKQSG